MVRFYLIIIDFLVDHVVRYNTPVVWHDRNHWGLYFVFVFCMKHVGFGSNKTERPLSLPDVVPRGWLHAVTGTSTPARLFLVKSKVYEPRPEIILELKLRIRVTTEEVP